MDQTINPPADEAIAGRTAADDEQAAGTNSMVEGRYERIKAAEAAHRALLARPRISLHLQINLAFLLIFLFVLAISVALVSSICIQWKAACDGLRSSMNLWRRSIRPVVSKKIIFFTAAI